MKIAEALIIRTDLQKNVSQLQARLLQNAQVQEGTEVTEKPEELLNKLRKTLAELQDMVIKINRANIESKDENGISLADLLAQRDILDIEIKTVREFLDKAAALIQPYNRLEIKVFPSVNVEDYRKSLDGLSKNRRELEIKIQNLNWISELK